jgi:hypothetical protein
LEHIHDFGLEAQHAPITKQQVPLGIQAERTEAVGALTGHEFGSARKNIRKISVSREDIYLVAALNTNATAARVRAAMRRPTALRPLEDFAHVR